MTANSKAAMARGTEMHSYIEAYLKAVKIGDQREIRIAKRSLELGFPNIADKVLRLIATEFLDKGYEIFATEKTCGIADDIAGTADAIFVTPKGRLIFVDWKLSKFSMSNPWRFNGVCLPPIEAFPCDTSTKYALQINFYARLALGPNYTEKQPLLYICRFDPEGEPELVEMPLLHHEVNAMIAQLSTFTP